MLWSDFKNNSSYKEGDLFLLWLEDPTTTSEDLFEQMNLPTSISDTTNKTQS